MKDSERNRLVTITMVQTLLDVLDYTANETSLIRLVARDAGLYPLKEGDRKILRKGIGVERTCRFERACEYKPYGTTALQAHALKP